MRQNFSDVPQVTVLGNRLERLRFDVAAQNARVEGRDLFVEGSVSCKFMLAATKMGPFTHTAAIMMDWLRCAWARSPAGMLIPCTMLHGYRREHSIVRDCATREYPLAPWLHARAHCPQLVEITVSEWPSILNLTRLTKQQLNCSLVEHATWNSSGFRYF